MGMPLPMQQSGESRTTMNTKQNTTLKQRGFITLVEALLIAALALVGPAIVLIDGSVNNPPTKDGQPWPNLPTMQ